MNEKLKMPKHVAIIVDGNGRWAKDRGLTRSQGHQNGANRIEEIIHYVATKDIDVISLYVFSTENFKRSNEEVDYLMMLFKKRFKQMNHKFNKENIKVVFSGREEPLPKDVIEMEKEMTEKTKNNTGLIVNFCLNYGSHAEITDACKKIAKKVEEGKLKPENIDEDVISKHLYQDLPPVDFLIRTSGEQRLSNFLLWQLSYAEFYFPEVPFPDFTKEEFDKAILKYNKRDRRFGGINYENKDH